MSVVELTNKLAELDNKLQNELTNSFILAYSTVIGFLFEMQDEKTKTSKKENNVQQNSNNNHAQNQKSVQQLKTRLKNQIDDFEKLINKDQNEQTCKQQYSKIINIIKQTLSNQDQINGEQIVNQQNDQQQHMQFNKQFTNLSPSVTTQRQNSVQLEKLSQVRYIEMKSTLTQQNAQQNHLLNIQVSEVDKLNSELSQLKEQIQQLQNVDEIKLKKQIQALTGKSECIEIYEHVKQLQNLHIQQKNGQQQKLDLSNQKQDQKAEILPLRNAKTQNFGVTQLRLDLESINQIIVENDQDINGKPTEEKASESFNQKKDANKLNGYKCVIESDEQQDIELIKAYQQSLDFQEFQQYSYKIMNLRIQNIDSSNEDIRVLLKIDQLEDWFEIIYESQYFEELELILQGQEICDIKLKISAKEKSETIIGKIKIVASYFELNDKHKQELVVDLKGVCL